MLLFSFFFFLVRIIHVLYYLSYESHFPRAKRGIPGFRALSEAGGPAVSPPLCPAFLFERFPSPPLQSFSLSLNKTTCHCHLHASPLSLFVWLDGFCLQKLRLDVGRSLSRSFLRHWWRWPAVGMLSFFFTPIAPVFKLKLWLRCHPSEARERASSILNG